MAIDSISAHSIGISLLNSDGLQDLEARCSWMVFIDIWQRMVFKGI